MNKLLSRVASVMCALVFVSECYAAPSLDVPIESEDATFVVAVDWAEAVELKDKHISLYRNFQGGEFELIATGQAIRALSQVVLKNGVYGYKFHWKDEKQSIESETAFIEVDSPVLRYTLPEPNEQRSYSLGMSR